MEDNLEEKIEEEKLTPKSVLNSSMHSGTVIVFAVALLISLLLRIASVTVALIKSSWIEWLFEVPEIICMIFALIGAFGLVKSGENDMAGKFSLIKVMTVCELVVSIILTIVAAFLFVLILLFGLETQLFQTGFVGTNGIPLLEEYTEIIEDFLKEFSFVTPVARFLMILGIALLEFISYFICIFAFKKWTGYLNGLKFTSETGFYNEDYSHRGILITSGVFMIITCAAMLWITFMLRMNPLHSCATIFLGLAAITSGILYDKTHRSIEKLAE